jgi:hypothetical protein
MAKLPKHLDKNRLNAESARIKEERSSPPYRENQTIYKRESDALKKEKATKLALSDARYEAANYGYNVIHSMRETRKKIEQASQSVYDSSPVAKSYDVSPKEARPNHYYLDRQEKLEAAEKRVTANRAKVKEKQYDKDIVLPTGYGREIPAAYKKAGETIKNTANKAVENFKKGVKVIKREITRPR